jgi:hypothetical protein
MPRLLLTLLLLGLTIYAAVDCIQTEESRQRHLPKVLWLLLILLFPVVGPVCWFLAGRSGPARRSRPGNRPPTRVAPTTTPTSSVTCDRTIRSAHPLS